MNKPTRNESLILWCAAPRPIIKLQIRRLATRWPSRNQFYCNDSRSTSRIHNQTIQWNATFSGQARTSVNNGHETRPHARSVYSWDEHLTFSVHVYSPAFCLRRRMNEKIFNFLLFALPASAKNVCQPHRVWARATAENLNFAMHICGVLLFVTDQHYSMVYAISAAWGGLGLLAGRCLSICRIRLRKNINILA